MACASPEGREEYGGTRRERGNLEQPLIGFRVVNDGLALKVQVGRLAAKTLYAIRPNLKRFAPPAAGALCAGGDGFFWRNLSIRFITNPST